MKPHDNPPHRHKKETNDSTTVPLVQPPGPYGPNQDEPPTTDEVYPAVPREDERKQQKDR